MNGSFGFLFSFSKMEFKNLGSAWRLQNKSFSHLFLSSRCQLAFSFRISFPVLSLTFLGLCKEDLLLTHSTSIVLIMKGKCTADSPYHVIFVTRGPIIKPQSIYKLDVFNTVQTHSVCLHLISNTVNIVDNKSTQRLFFRSHIFWQCKFLISLISFLTIVCLHLWTGVCSTTCQLSSTFLGKMQGFRQKTYLSFSKRES